MSKLTINLIPRTSFFKNVRSEVSKEQWDILRKKCYKLANYRCEICDGVGEKHPVECHEIWEYDDKNKIQKLVRLIALCPSCHEVNHIGFAEINGRGDIAIEHLMKVNNWTKRQALNHRYQAFRLWAHRNTIKWKLDLTYLGK